jgi:ABC-type polysaccharide/polyol phosphate transport system ATPase subunit
MPLIEFDDVHLDYPVKEHHGVSLKELIVRGLFRNGKRPVRKYVSALRGVTFRIGDGERVAIIGGNGAGKSTLLRTIADVYPVTSGRARVEGRVCALYDIYAGFDWDSTGWENLFSRSYLQGDSPRRVEEKARDIVAFAELGDFVELPLRCYSTGMIMRLAFAVATACAAEVLLIDEVFSTGDLAFHHKARARLDNLMRQASIVVMVGHDLDLLQQSCDRALWLDQGRVRADGPVAAVIDEYRDASAQRALVA